jgi:hypothetical protein
MKDTDMATGDNSFDDALVAAENLLVNALDLGERDVDLIGLFQNAMATIRNNPEATFRSSQTTTPSQRRPCADGGPGGQRGSPDRRYATEPPRLTVSVHNNPSRPTRWGGLLCAVTIRNRGGAVRVPIIRILKIHPTPA